MGEKKAGWEEHAVQIANKPRTFIFEEITHPRPPSQHELRYILDNLGLLLG
jgi:hypothetical protein